MIESRCPWCHGTGFIERVRACPCRAPEKADELTRLLRSATAVHDDGCDGNGWVYIKVPCDHGKGYS
jgi:hypothetical protein